MLAEKAVCQKFFMKENEKNYPVRIAMLITNI